MVIVKWYHKHKIFLPPPHWRKIQNALQGLDCYCLLIWHLIHHVFPGEPTVPSVKRTDSKMFVIFHTITTLFSYMSHTKTHQSQCQVAMEAKGAWLQWLSKHTQLEYMKYTQRGNQKGRATMLIRLFRSGPLQDRHYIIRKELARWEQFISSSSLQYQQLKTRERHINAQHSRTQWANQKEGVSADRKHMDWIPWKSSQINCACLNVHVWEWWLD